MQHAVRCLQCASQTQATSTAKILKAIETLKGHETSEPLLVTAP